MYLRESSPRRLNVVSEPKGWVLGWIAEMLSERLGCSVSGIPGKGANIYVPYYFLRKKTDRDVALFTHYDNYELWDQAVELADVCVSMSAKATCHLPAEKTVVIPIPPDPQFRRRIVFGVSGRDYSNYGTGRKRTDWITKLRTLPNIEIRFTDGKVPWKDMPQWYREIDYLLVLADNEGGPMGVVEAIASGRPVIAPDVGWSWDYPVLRYEAFDDLVGIIRRLSTTPDAWDIAAEKFRALC